MNRRKTLKLIHFVATLWFIVCLAGIFALALRQAGYSWWIIFSLSGHSAWFVFLLVSLYLFAVFRGADRDQKIEVEHPLTTTTCYAVFYVTSPFLGGIAGCLGMADARTAGQFLVGIALGTLGTTFLVWVVLDPVIGLLEMLLPASRKHRAERLTRVRALRQRRQQDKQRLLADMLDREERDRRRRQQVLQPYAERLAGLFTVENIDYERARNQAVDIGVDAWRLEGLGGMQQLRDMVLAICRQTDHAQPVFDYISAWWDGIGTWRNIPLA
ncbi:MAG: hypothetical protein ACYTBJ_06595 [Planctomycetota bacterium]